MIKLPELESFFASADLPEEIIIGDHMRITDVRKCVDLHLSYLRGNPGNSRFKPYYDRLLIIREKVLSL